MYLSSCSCSTLGPQGTTGCWVVRLRSPQSWEGWQRMSPWGSGRDRRRDRREKWRDGEEGKEARECRSERSYSLWCDLTPQGNTVCERRQRRKVLHHLPPLQFPFPQSDIFSACPSGYGAHTSDIVHFNAISTTIPWWEKGQWNFIAWGEKSFCLLCCHRPYSVGSKGSLNTQKRTGRHSGALQRKS